MKKTLLVTVLSVIILSCLFCLPVFSDGEANYAEIAPGGVISSIADVEAVFGEGNVTVEAEGETVNIYFERSVKLSATVFITRGTYRIYGRDCTLFRGFENGPLVSLNSFDENVTKLIISEKSMTDWETGKSAVFTFDGNAAEYPTAKGSLISVVGNASVDFNGKVLFKNSVNKGYGGAIYAEAVADEGDTVCSPTIKLQGCKITECVSSYGGGGIALTGGKNGEGEVLLSNVIIEKCKAQNDGKTGSGGAFYLNGGTVKLSESCTVNNNTADLGGAAYVSGYAEIESVTMRDNYAAVSGGIIYCENDAKREAAGTVVMSNSYLSYGESDGNGGAITNKGTLHISGTTYITDCKAKGDGGAVYNLGSFGFSTGDIITNKADGKAGAIYNGKSGILIVSGGRISSNDAALCGGIYSEGAFEFKGGSIGKSLGTAPQNLVCGVMRISDSATFTDTEVLGILVRDGEAPTVISVAGKLTSLVKQTVAFYKNVTDKNGAEVLRLCSESGMQVFSSEDAEALESAVKGFKVYGEGLKKYKLASDGTLAFKLPLMPLWGWILTLIAIAGVTVGAVFGVKLLIKNRADKDGSAGEDSDDVDTESEGTEDECFKYRDSEEDGESETEPND